MESFYIYIIDTKKDRFSNTVHLSVKLHTERSNHRTHMNFQI